MAIKERRRAYLGEDVVTILNQSGQGRNADVEIRLPSGFTKTVKRKELQMIDLSEPNAKLKFDPDIN